MRLVHGVVTRMEDDEAQLLAQRSAALQARVRLARLTAWTGVLVALALASLASVLVGRGMAGRRVAEERLRLLVGSVRDYAIYMVDPAGYVGSWNAGAERIKGYAPAEILGQHFARFFTPEDVAAGRRSARSVGRESLRALLHAGRRRRRPSRGRAARRRDGGTLRGGELAGPQGRFPLLGGRRDHRPARRPRQAAGIRQGDARPHRAEACRAGAARQ